MFPNCIFAGGNAAENVGCSFLGFGMIIWSCVYTLCVACPKNIFFMKGEMLQKIPVKDKPKGNLGGTYIQISIFRLPEPPQVPQQEQNAPLPLEMANV
jgi:hypothetical protein